MNAIQNIIEMMNSVIAEMPFDKYLCFDGALDRASVRSFASEPYAHNRHFCWAVRGSATQLMELDVGNSPLLIEQWADTADKEQGTRFFHIELSSGMTEVSANKARELANGHPSISSWPEVELVLSRRLLPPFIYMVQLSDGTWNKWMQTLKQDGYPASIALATVAENMRQAQEAAQ